MDAESYKILETDMEGKGVSAQPNPMELPEAEAKAVFDQLVKEVVVPKFNELLEALASIDLTSDLDKPISTAAQAALDLKVNKAWKTGSETEYKVLSDNNYSDSELTKLAGIADNANNYTHPATHDVSMIVESTTKRFFSDSERTKLGGIADNANNYTHPATHDASMIIESTTKRFFTDLERTKLGGIADNANNYTHPATHDASMIVESTTKRFFSDSERTKLGGIADNANNYIHPTTHDAGMITGLAVVAKTGNYSDLGGLPTLIQNVVDGNNTSAVRTTGAKSDYTMGQYAFAEGTNTVASGIYSHAEGNTTTASGGNSHAEGYRTTASGNDSHAEGYNTIASGTNSHAEGNGTQALGSYGAHAEGYHTKSSGSYGAHAEGDYTTASGDSSHAEGKNTTASNYYAHAQGKSTSATATCSHAEGDSTVASGITSHTEGTFTTAETFGLHTQGQYNTVNAGSFNAFSLTQNAFVIGNGTTSDAKSNCFRVDYSGNVYGLSAFNSTGADYAEYFEWEDENLNSEDRRGKFVTLNGDRIEIAQEGDFILGVVSSNPAIVGNHPSEVWKDMYLTDVWGDYVMEWRTIPAQTEMVTINHDEIVSENVVVITEDGEEQTVTQDKIVTTTEEVEQVIVEEHQEYLPVINPDYDPSQIYISRDKRNEWATIGMMGQLIVYTDGSCAVNGFCKCGNDGVATTATEGYRVLKVIDDNKILILLK